MLVRKGRRGFRRRLKRASLGLEIKRERPQGGLDEEVKT
jgi:hypothetical protein